MSSLRNLKNLQGMANKMRLRDADDLAMDAMLWLIKQGRENTLLSKCEVARLVRKFAWKRMKREMQRAELLRQHAGLLPAGLFGGPSEKSDSPISRASETTYAEDCESCQRENRKRYERGEFSRATFFRNQSLISGLLR